MVYYKQARGTQPLPPYHNTSTAQTSMLHPIEQNIHVPVLRISKVMYIVCQVSLRITLSVCVPHLQRDKHDAAKCDVWRTICASAHERSRK
jgi:hypothetical protein